MPTDPKWHPVDDFLEILSRQDAPLIGGQAVNLWAVHYQSRLPELERLAPFVSHDCDLIGNAGTLQKLNSLTGAELKWTEAGAASPVVGFADFSKCFPAKLKDMTSGAVKNFCRYQLTRNWPGSAR